MVRSAPTSPSVVGGTPRGDSGGQLLKELEALSQALYKAGQQPPPPRKEVSSPYPVGRAEPQSPYLRGREEPPSPYLRGREDLPSYLRRREEMPAPYLRGREDPPSPYHQGKDDPPSPYHQGREDPPSPYHRGRDEPPSPYLRGRDELPAPYLRGKEAPPSPYLHGKEAPPSPYLHGKEAPPSPYLGKREEPPSPYMGRREGPPSPYLGRREGPPHLYLGGTDATSPYPPRKEAQSPYLLRNETIPYLPKNEATSPHLTRRETMPARTVSDSYGRPGSLTPPSLYSSALKSPQPRPPIPPRPSASPSSTDFGKKTGIYRLDAQRAEDRSPSSSPSAAPSADSAKKTATYRLDLQRAGPQVPNNDGPRQSWHSQGFEKNLPEVTNFPAWLQDNLNFSQKLQAKKEKKSFWNWKPFRAIVHMGQQRFNCVFTVHVHGIEGLPSAMNGLRLTVHWRRKESVAQTMPSRVFQGSAEFEETLNLKCTVYGSKNGSHAVKYTSKNFDLSVIALDVDKLVLGKHRLDLSRLLPENLDDNSDDEKQNSWTTSFKLSGKAKGGTLVVTFGYQIVNKDFEPSISSAPSFGDLRNLNEIRSYSLPNSPTGIPRARPLDAHLSPTLSEPPADLSEYLGMEHLSLDESVTTESPYTSGQYAQKERMRPEVKAFPTGAPTIILFPQVKSLLAPPTPQQSEEKASDLTKESSHEHQAEDPQVCSEDEAEFTVVDRGTEMYTLSTYYGDEAALQEELVDGSAGMVVQEEDQAEDSTKLHMEGNDHVYLNAKSLAEREETQGEDGAHELDDEEEERTSEVPTFGDSEMQDVVDAMDIQEDQLQGEKEDGSVKLEDKNEEEGDISQSWAADSPYCFMRKDSNGDDEEDKKEGPDLAGESTMESKEIFEYLIETDLPAAEQENSKTEESDDEIDLVAGEFLNLLETERGPTGVSSDSEADSPRALLLKQFEQEALIEGGVGLGLTLPEVHEPTFVDMPDELHLEGGPMEDHESRHKSSLSDDFSAPGWGSEEDTELASIMEAAESELQKATQTMQSKNRAKLLEDAETEALMQEWGLNAEAFEGLPPKPLPLQDYDSPYSSALVHMPRVPPLGQGMGPLVQTRDGGSLRSMSPMHFQASSVGGQLVMQVSKPLVVPAEMGSNSMDILRHMAAAGMEGMAVQAMMAMPLEDITGKSVEQIASEGTAALEGGNHQLGKFRNGYAALGPAGSGETGLSLEHGDGVSWGGSLVNRAASSMATNSRGYNRRKSSFANTTDEYMSLEDLAPMAMQKIEALAMEGLKIQADMTEDEAPYSVDALSWQEMALEGGSKRKRSVGIGKLEGVAAMHLLEGGSTDEEASSSSDDGLMSMAISLDEWMRLDAGMYDETQDKENTMAILAAHHAIHKDVVVVGKPSDNDKVRWRRPGGKGGASDMGGGFMGDTLTLAMLVQLRDPLRNYEPMGAPMMALVQAERVSMPPRPKLGKRISMKGNSEEAEEAEVPPQPPQFKIVQVTMSGLKASENTSEKKKGGWGNQKQQQSGSRWLVANGMGKSAARHPVLKSKAPPAKTKVQKGESLWSISARVHGTGTKWQEVAALNPHIRNPDVIFPNTSIRMR